MTSLPEFLCHNCGHSIDTHSLGEPCGVGGDCDCVQTPRDITAHHMTASPKISALLVRVGQNMGDHAQDVVVAVEIEPGETVEALAARLFTQRWVNPIGKKPEYEWRIEIRMVQPAREEGGVVFT